MESIKQTAVLILAIKHPNGLDGASHVLEKTHCNWHPVDLAITHLTAGHPWWPWVPVYSCSKDLGKQTDAASRPKPDLHGRLPMAFTFLGHPFDAMFEGVMRKHGSTGQQQSPKRLTNNAIKSLALWTATLVPEENKWPFVQWLHVP